MRLWNSPGAEIVTSAYAVEEARRNLASAEQLVRLEALLERTRIVPESSAAIPAAVKMAEKDLPILKAAVAAEATHLVTGDLKDFGRYFGREVAGVLVVTPEDFLKG
jgi:predicted nucleic acid-binding protein